MLYEVIELSPPPGSKPYMPPTMARAVNEGGSAAGYTNLLSGNPPGALLEPATWDEAGVPEVPQPLPWSGGAEALNDQGVFVGWFQPNGQAQRAFICQDGEQLEDIAPALGTEVNGACDINNSGIVVGWERADEPTASGAPFVYDTNSGSVTVLKPLKGHDLGFAIAVNESGHVIGLSRKPQPNTPAIQLMHLFIYREGETEDFGAGMVHGPAGLRSCALNNWDVITGSRVTPQTQIANAFRLNANAAAPSLEDLGQELPADFAGSFGIGINDDEVIVGAALDETNTPHAMVHFPAGSHAGWHDLNDLLIDGDSWDLQIASAISNSGYIVGDGLHHNERRSFLLKPRNLTTDKIADIVYVLIMIIGGGTVDAPGSIGITPGSKPVPIDPQEFKRLWNTLSPSEKDLYLGQAISNLGSLVANDERREQVAIAGTAVIKEAIEESFGEGR